MNRKVVAACVAALVLIGLALYSAQRDLKEPDTPQEIEAEQTDVQRVECAYYLVEDLGYVNVCLGDGKTIYEYTEIRVEDLPEALMAEIRQGKSIKNEQELYDFLENYSS
jgi:hypothetical protein